MRFCHTKLGAPGMGWAEGRDKEVFCMCLPVYLRGALSSRVHVAFRVFTYSMSQSMAESPTPLFKLAGAV